MQEPQLNGALWKVFEHSTYFKQSLLTIQSKLLRNSVTLKAKFIYSLGSS